MKLFSKSILIPVYYAASAFFLPAAAQQPSKTFSPPKGARMVLLGNTFADRMRHYGYFEAFLQKNFPNHELRLRNMGWSADEVGLQPRPLNFPGFGEKAAPRPADGKEVTFQGYKHEGEPVVMPVALNFAGLNQDLSDQKADVIFLCFGLNEAFRGPAGLPDFERDLDRFIRNLQEHRYNGHSAPQLVLVSPIAHEKLGGFLPDPGTHNKNLELYTAAMQKMAADKEIYFIDLFHPFSDRMRKSGGAPLTINGIHLNDAGYRLAAEWMARALGMPLKPELNSENGQKLKQVIKLKDDHFFYRWRAVNGEYIYGRRREPFGVIAFPPELRKLNQMTAALDSVIWALGRSNDAKAFARALEITDRRGKPVDPDLIPEIPMLGRQGKAAQEAAAHNHHQHSKTNDASTETFRLPEGYEINLFASEKDFPIEKPVAMNFDAKGRLWVATMPTYPQYFPGIPVHDKIVILEDTNGDGKADKHTVFADDLYLPLGFEFGNGGVYVSQEPDLVFLKDTDGDDKADVREVILTGFGSEDSHHATHAFTWGQDGALYFNEGTFLNSQVETPYGPVRSYAGATYRFEPRTWKLSNYISYPYYNPWGSVFDKWGTHLIGDASDGSNYFAPPLTGRVEYPDKHPRTETFTETRVRPTAGIELISSRHFPDDVQGDFLVNNNIGFQGTKQHRIEVNGSGIVGKEVQALLQSTDPNFRPIDLEFGPDGALYIVDWYNPLISHGENPPRDPARDRSHGRVWRISYKNKPLLKSRNLSGQNVAELLENLKVHEDRLRYRSRYLSREKPADEVLPALKKWTSALDRNDPDYEHRLLEALWLYQDFNVVEEPVLRMLLEARNYRARAAATRVLRFWHDRVPDALALMRKRVNDAEPRVRLEAVTALSFFDSGPAVEAALDIFKYPLDHFLSYAVHETFTFHKPYWLDALKNNRIKLSPKAAAFLLQLVPASELTALPRTPEVLTAVLTRENAGNEQKQEALRELSKAQQTTSANVLLGLLQREEIRRRPQHIREELVQRLLLSDPAELRKQKADFTRLIKEDSSALLRAAGYAAVLTAENSDQSVRDLANRNDVALADYVNGIALLAAPDLKTGFYKKAEELTKRIPEAAYPVVLKMAPAGNEKLRVMRNYIGYLQETATLAPEALARAAALLKSMLQEVPEAERQALLPQVDNLGTTEIKLVAVEAKMAFDKQRVSVKAGKSVSLVFENPDLMPHNVVIVKPGTAERVGEAADAMASGSDGFEKHFVPDMPEVLFATPLVNSGKTFRLNFKAPEQPGEYPYLCSFPGHWRVMQGVLVVE